MNAAQRGPGTTHKEQHGEALNLKAAGPCELHTRWTNTNTLTQPLETVQVYMHKQLGMDNTPGSNTGTVTCSARTAL